MAQTVDGMLSWLKDQPQDCESAKKTFATSKTLIFAPSPDLLNLFDTGGRDL
jgi:hypothetical protein